MAALRIHTFRSCSTASILPLLQVAPNVVCEHLGVLHSLVQNIIAFCRKELFFLVDMSRIVEMFIVGIYPEVIDEWQRHSGGRSVASCLEISGN